jgi:Quinolinate synthetase A protein/Phage integrase family
VLNPVPREREWGSTRPHAHHNPLQPFAPRGRLRYNPRLPRLRPRALPEAEWSALFSALRSDRDRAILAMALSSGARAGELLGIRGGDLDWGEQLVRVRRKGTRAQQWLPVSAESLVWLRLYLDQIGGVSVDEPVWQTMRRRRLGRHASPALAAGELGHAHLTTTQTYLQDDDHEVISRVRAHLAQTVTNTASSEADVGRDFPVGVPDLPGYRSEDLAVLFSVFLLVTSPIVFDCKAKTRKPDEQGVPGRSGRGGGTMSISELTAPPVRADWADQVRRLARERDAVVLAHNYQLPEIQDVAHHTGDSLALSRIAAAAEESTIVFCGVHFMAETAKILAPDKTVLTGSAQPQPAAPSRRSTSRIEGDA